MNILGKHIILRAIERDDLSILHRWGNDPEIQNAMGIIRFPSSRDFHNQWFEKNQSDEKNQRWIIQTHGGEILGLSSIINIDWRNRRAWHGILIGNSEYQNSFFGVDAVFTTMRYAFEELNFERLDGAVIEYNNKSLKLFCSKIIGWEIEGRRKKYFYHEGSFWDQILIGITKEKYHQIKHSNPKIFGVKSK